jgi:hypothetical protein
VYDKLIDQFEKHSLLTGTVHDRLVDRCKNITKKHIHTFLKELKICKHYENINLIHYNLTGKKPDDISHLEQKLLNDFDKLSKMYDIKYKTNVKRKNFINTQYILYRLLKRHKHPCDVEDFSILKTIDRKSFHDSLTLDLLSVLSWNYN